MRKIALILALLLILLTDLSKAYANLTKEQAEDVADFATSFIEKGNQRRDENGYPLLVYALNGSTATSVELRRTGYDSELYYIKNNNYHRKNGYYLELGYKWCMDCGDFVAFVYHQTLDLDLKLQNNDPWHCIDMYNDANKYDNSKYFEFIYKNVPIYSLDDTKMQPGDIVLKIGPGDNHAGRYVGEGFRCAHASRNGIKYYLNPPILGFEEIVLNRFYKSSTIVSVVRLKDGIVPEDKIVNGLITWPDTNEQEDLLSYKRPVEEEPIEIIYSGDNIKIYLENGQIIEFSENEDNNLMDIENEFELSNDFINFANNSGIYIDENMKLWISKELRKFFLDVENGKTEIS